MIIVFVSQLYSTVRQNCLMAPYIMRWANYQSFIAGQIFLITRIFSAEVKKDMTADVALMKYMKLEHFFIIVQNHSLNQNLSQKITLIGKNWKLPTVHKIYMPSISNQSCTGLFWIIKISLKSINIIL